MSKHKTTKPSYKPTESTASAQEPAAAYSKQLPKLKVLKNNILSAGDSEELSILALVRASREGVKYSTFEKIASSSSFSMEEWSSYLHLSSRSMLRYKKEKKAFDPIQSEKILQIALLYQKGTEVFGDASSFDTWLSSTVVALGGLVPKTLLDNSFGIRLLTDQLGRIEHGVLA